MKKYVSAHLFITNTFISNARLKLAKKQEKAKQHTGAELLLFETCFLHPHYHPKIIRAILQNVQKRVRLFKSGYMMNGNENEAENQKKIKQIRHK